MKYGVLPAFVATVAAAVLLLAPASADAQQVRISRLADAPFGTLSNFTTDQQFNDSVCVFSSAAGRRYRVTATGSGTGGAFTLASGANRMAYEVQWATASGQTSGTALSAGIALAGLTTTAANSGCTVAPTNTATLITILRANAKASATVGSYTGTLTILIAPD